MNILKKSLAAALSLAALGGTIVSQVKAAPIDMSSMYREVTDRIYSDYYRNGGVLHGYLIRVYGPYVSSKPITGISRYYRYNAHEARVKHDKSPYWGCDQRYDEGWTRAQQHIGDYGIKGSYFEFDGGDIW